MKFRIWCEVWGGVTGSRCAWMTDARGQIVEFDRREDAQEEADECNRTANGPNARASFEYTVKEV